MKLLVTGGAGFIGSHLVKWLGGQGHRVRVLDNFSTGRRAALVSASSAIKVITGDIRDFATVYAAVRDMDVIIHLAAMVSVIQSIEQPLIAQAINATGSLHVLEAARQAGVRRVVLASSCAVYGNNDRLPFSEAEMPNPLSPYAATKLAAEQASQLYSQLYGLESVALRFFNVYGPGQDPASPYAAVVPRFIAMLQRGRRLAGRPLDGLQPHETERRGAAGGHVAELSPNHCVRHDAGRFDASHTHTAMLPPPHDEHIRAAGDALYLVGELVRAPRLYVGAKRWPTASRMALRRPSLPRASAGLRTRIPDGGGMLAAPAICRTDVRRSGGMDAANAVESLVLSRSVFVPLRIA
jgi:nucleoside-diphosphate-sugar epimerase